MIHNTLLDSKPDHNLLLSFKDSDERFVVLSSALCELVNELKNLAWPSGDLSSEQDVALLVF